MDVRKVLWIVVFASVLAGRLALADTAVVVHYTPQEVVIAADSKRIDAAGGEEASLVCKLVVIGDFVFFATHFVRDQATGYDIQELVIHAAESKGTLGDVIDRFERLLKPAFAGAIKTVKEEALQNLESAFPDGEVSVNTIFVGLEGNKLIYSDKRLWLNWKAPFLIPTFEQYQPTSFRAFGSREMGLAIVPFLNDEQFWLQEGPVNGTKKVVELAIQAVPEKIGGPIAIVKINAQGAQWVEKPAHCERVE